MTFCHISLQMEQGTYSQCKAELSGSFDNLFKVDAMVQLIFIKLYEQLQELGPLVLEGEGGRGKEGGGRREDESILDRK